MSDPLHIRAARPGDRAAITWLFRRSYPRLLPEDYDAVTLHAALPYLTTAQPALLSCGTYYLAEDCEGQVIGAGGWTDVSPTRGIGAIDEGHLRHVACDPDHLRKGVARRLVEEALTSARGFGMRRMHCMSTLTALAFYEAMGFEACGEVEVTLAPGVYFPAMQMVRAL